MFSSDIPDGWTPPEPPAIGSPRWLDDCAYSFMVEKFSGLPDKSGIWKLPDVVGAGQTYRMGYFVIFRSSYGADYKRFDDLEGS